MAGIVWSEPALAGLEAIADYIAIENHQAVTALVRRVLDHVAQLVDHPESGPVLPELPQSRYRQIVEPPCRIFYRYDAQTVWVLHVMRTERLLRLDDLAGRDRLLEPQGTPDPGNG